MEVRTHADGPALAHSAAELILADCKASLAIRSDLYTIGLSGGRTPRLMLEALAKLPLPWRQVHIFQVDERVAPTGSSDRNLTQLSHSLLDHIDIPSENVHPMPVETEDLAGACRTYDEELQDVTNGSPMDCLQLGLGEDGHTASLPPGHPILDITDRAIWYVDEFNDLPRMSMTFPPINHAARVIWLAVGSAKADMCRRLVESDSTIPAGRVEQANAVLLLDEEAAAGL